jgi:hypothetical protein
MNNAAPSTQSIEPGDVVMLNAGIENKCGIMFAASVLRTGSPHDLCKVAATYLGTRRIIFLDVPWDHQPSALHGIGLRRQARTLITLHAFMTDAGIVYASLGSWDAS